jgi:hypothetical protein
MLDEHSKGVDMKTNYLTTDELYYACYELLTGRHGSFAKAIAEAYSVADKGNSQKLVEAFPDLFERGYHFWQASKLTTV